MDTDAVERLTKGLYIQKKRKGKAPSESSKWVKVRASNPTAPTALEVRPRDEVILTTRIIVVEGESLPPEPANLSSRDRASDPPANKEKERRKGKVAIMKKARKVCLNEPNRGSSEDQGPDLVGNLDIIRELTDRLALLEEMDRLTDLDQR
ncbi:hypothetical protein COCNU_03G002860 [Cocos nucifera]|uniref:Uncharacterized protein n=1 Tax=Cocos nucifera TaxID=13894 RepID=A0A8K0MXW5_COCNU|nr:hypothetical protein COCNU_03G002860 [Cocos nucifera]